MFDYYKTAVPKKEAQKTRLRMKSKKTSKKRGDDDVPADGITAAL